MEADDERRGRDGPDTVGAFAHVEARPHSHPHLLRVRSHDTKERSVVGVEAGVFRLGMFSAAAAFVAIWASRPCAERYQYAITIINRSSSHSREMFDAPRTRVIGGPVTERATGPRMNQYGIEGKPVGL